MSGGPLGTDIDQGQHAGGRDAPRGVGSEWRAGGGGGRRRGRGRSGARDTPGGCGSPRDRVGTHYAGERAHSPTRLLRTPHRGGALPQRRAVGGVRDGVGGGGWGRSRAAGGGGPENGGAGVAAHPATVGPAAHPARQRRPPYRAAGRGGSGRVGSGWAHRRRPAAGPAAAPRDAAGGAALRRTGVPGVGGEEPWGGAVGKGGWQRRDVGESSGSDPSVPPRPTPPSSSSPAPAARLNLSRSAPRAPPV